MRFIVFCSSSWITKLQCTVNLKLSYSYSAETVCIINADVNQQPFSPAFMWLYLTLPAENCLLISTVTFENMPSGHRRVIRIKRLSAGWGFLSRLCIVLWNTFQEPYQLHPKHEQEHQKVSTPSENQYAKVTKRCMWSWGMFSGLCTTSQQR